MVHIFCATDSSKETFTFTFSAGPLLEFSFAKPVTVPVETRKPFKRRRALSDVDGGGGNEGRKKRRLRLHLITSRLSRPFSQPASNIAASNVGNGISKISVWGARDKRHHGKSVLRKCAIMNRVRMRMDAAKDFMRLEQEKRRERESLSLREIVLVKPPRLQDPPLPPSPLGLSNYDALDLEEDFLGLDDEDEDGEGSDGFVCDFNIMHPTGPGGEDYELLDALDGIDGISKEDLPEEPPTPPPEDSIAEMLKEDRRVDGYFSRVTI